MKGELIFREKQTLDGYIREMIIWRLHKPVSGCRHQFKYRFFFGREDGTCLVHYDNEPGKGDHKHIGGRAPLSLPKFGCNLCRLSDGDC